MDPNSIVSLHQIPSLQIIYTLDAVISKVQVSRNEHFSKVAAETDLHKSFEITKNLLPATLQLIDIYTAFTRSILYLWLAMRNVVVVVVPLPFPPLQNQDSPV